MTDAAEFPQMMHTAIDTTNARELAEFYRQLLGLRYRPGDEPPAEGPDDGADCLVLLDADGTRKLAFQEVEHLKPTTWPTHDVPMQMHTTSGSPASPNWIGTGSGPRYSAPECSWTGPLPRSRCTCSPTRPVTRSASSSAERGRRYWGPSESTGSVAVRGLSTRSRHCQVGSGRRCQRLMKYCWGLLCAGVPNRYSSSIPSGTL
ncbi:VOC family protein [Actinopolymorpha pittospori]|uniref:Glyoxalase-like domain-containing protein n=1 Tax=Actinopolymorpha pittospori TaxID=648752 RepID=A0A927R7L4_9ACTN|nr:hypothetical protein [Actinopolymorpha pittospori]